jgi:hypothetical protein
LIFERAAQNWQAGAGLYGSVAKDLDVYRYSPLVAGLLVPLSWLPTGPASIIWVLINAGVFLGTLYWWLHVVSDSRNRVTYAILTLAVLPLAIHSLHNGQSNALVIGLVLAGVAGVARERWNLAAAAMALATLLKIYPLAVGLILAALYPRRFGARLAIALGLGLLLPFLLQQPGYVFGQYAEWLAYLRRDDRAQVPVVLWMRDFRLLCRAWLGTPSPFAYLLIQGFAALTVGGLCLAAARRCWPKWELFTLVTGLGCSWMTLFGPATESCTYIVLAPSLGLALVAARSGDPLWKRGLLVGIFALLLGGYACRWFSLTKPLSDLGIQPLGALLFFLLIGGEALIRVIRRTEPLAIEERKAAA